MPVRSMEIPPRTAATWPSSEVPAPNAITGTPCAAQQADDAAYILGRGRERHRIGQVQRMVALAAAVLLAQGCRGAEPVAERRRQLRQRRLSTPLVPSPSAMLYSAPPIRPPWYVACNGRCWTMVGNRESGDGQRRQDVGLRLAWRSQRRCSAGRQPRWRWMSSPSAPTGRPQAEHGGFYQAVADGTYERHGLKVTIRPGGPQVNHSQLLAAGRIDLNMGGNMFEQFNFTQNDVPMVTVAAIFQKEPQVLLAHPDAGIDSFEDLKGKTLFIGNDGRLTYWLWLKQAYGLTDEQIKPYTFNPAPFLADKNSAQQGYVTSEPYRHQAAGRLRAGGADDGRCRLRHLLDHDRDLVEAGPGEAGRRPALRRRLGRGLVHLPLRRPVARPTR